MSLKSRLPEGGTNLFQAIKAKRAAAEAAGIKILNLAIGQPKGPALLSARIGAAEAVMSDGESMHEYQDNGSPGVPDFSRRFVEYHTGLLAGAVVEFLPIPGIKPMLGLIPLACGAEHKLVSVGTTTEPGYPTPAVWCKYLPLTVEHWPLPLSVENGFRFEPRRVPVNMDVLMINYPHNPSGQIATREWLEELCGHCARHNIRLFNDAAYAALAHASEHCTLTQVAKNFSELSWAEVFSASKLIGNGTGWRIGAMVGSPDFIADIATIKGNTDSGFVAPMAAGVLRALTHGLGNIETYRQKYHWRIRTLCSLLTQSGLRLAVEPQAGFFTLWQLPTRAFGERIESAERFNFMMIERTGVVGVHFHPYIRYAVCDSTVDTIEGREGIRQAFTEATVSYN